MPSLPNGTPKSIIDALSSAAEGLEERVIKERPMWEGNIFRISQLDVEQPDGTPGVRDIVWHHGGAGVAAVRDGKLCLVKQWRVALDRMTLEIPAGKIDAGEDPAVCAARELAEETGLVAESLEFVASSAGAPGFTNERTRIFLAHGLSTHPAHPDPDEFVDVLWVPVEDVIAASRLGVIKDAKTIIAAYAALAAEM
ncbi:MAG: NUDIX hydrolase [Atopobiaceae bacterium]|nr:NUDIX hydrolase [Atopobiaceae bacterium]